MKAKGGARDARGEPPASSSDAPLVPGADVEEVVLVLPRDAPDDNLPSEAREADVPSPQRLPRGAVDGVVRQVREGLRLPHGARARGVVVVRLGSSARPLAPNRSEEARGGIELLCLRSTSAYISVVVVVVSTTRRQRAISFISFRAPHVGHHDARRARGVVRARARGVVGRREDARGRGPRPVVARRVHVGARRAREGTSLSPLALVVAARLVVCLLYTSPSPRD